MEKRQLSNMMVPWVNASYTINEDQPFFIKNYS
jgi:hypothetical protein